MAVNAVYAAPPKKSDDKPLVLSHDAWQGVSRAPIQAGEIDRLIAQQLRQLKLESAPLTSDEQFVRRVMLDLTGRLPLPADVTEFVADTDPKKRERLIDRLLESEEYAGHWAAYWREVVATKVTDRRNLALTGSFEAWLAEQFKINRPWNTMVKEMLTASGMVPIGSIDVKAGPGFFLLAHSGPDAINDRTSETARVFLGIQIQCAQCHDHPFDGWKREQFHQLAGFFARSRDRLVRNTSTGAPFAGIELMSLPRGEHRMPDKADPTTGTFMAPKFLDGNGIRSGQSDQDRRRSLAEMVAHSENYWFAAAFVNRMWTEMMGQGFYPQVDDIGPGRDVVMPELLARLAASFRGSDFNIKKLLRAIALSDAYQRQHLPGSKGDGHLQFAASHLVPLRSEALWNSLVGVLGQLGQPLNAMGNPMLGALLAGRRFTNLELQFKNEFKSDPSTSSDDMEGSIPQALLLMNNPQINQKIRAEGSNLLGRILSAYPNDDDAVRMVYMRTLARKPTDRERERALAYVRKVGKRGEAFEDLLWVLINSTEFLNRR
jgi:hypothetical protein